LLLKETPEWEQAYKELRKAGWSENEISGQDGLK